MQIDSRNDPVWNPNRAISHNDNDEIMMRWRDNVMTMVRWQKEPIAR